MSLIDIDTNSLTNLPRIFMPFTKNPQQQPQKQQQSVNFSYRANDNNASCSGLTTDFPQLVSYGLTQQQQQQQQKQQQQVSSLSTMSGQPILNGATNLSNGGSNGQQQQIQQQQTAFNSSSALTNYSYNPSLLNMDDKAFDITVFDILKVDPDDIAGQLTLIDLPLFKQIQPDELISCKWMSREKLVKAPNIVQFTRRFNQTTFWCQKEILNCKRIETRGKMITIFIKIAKRLNELHSFNSLMAIIVALKGAPIYRLKKTWSQYVSKRDTALFERLSDIMLDTNDNKRKMRDTIMNCKLPCIPFLGLFLTDLIHIDIAHPHNSFDNPQRRNQMNNICRLISEYQQSNYQDLTSISCDCCFTTVAITEASEINASEPTTESKCLVSGCNCLIHHGTHKNGSGIINNDGTIYINDVSYIKNYLNSFLYIEELQKFKEEENYRDSLELEPEPNNSNNSSMSHSASQDKGKDCHPDKKAVVILHVSPSSPGKLSNSHNHATNNNAMNGVYDSKSGMNSKQSGVLDTNKNVTVSTCTGGSSSNNSNNTTNNNLSKEHRKSQSVTSNLFSFGESNNLQAKHPLDESIENNAFISCSNESNGHNGNTHNQSSGSGNHTDLINEIPLTVQQQKQLLANVKINDPSSLLRELLKHRHNNNNSSTLTNNTTRSSHSGHQHNHSSSTSFKNKLYPNCISNSSADVDDDSSEDEQHLHHNSDLDEEPHNNSISMESSGPNCTKSDVPAIDNSTPIKAMFNMSLNGSSSASKSLNSSASKQSKGGSKAKKNLLNSTLKSNKSSTVIAAHVMDLNENERRLSGRNLINSRDEDNFDSVDAILKNSRVSNSVRIASQQNTAISKTSSSSDLFSNLPNLVWNTNANNEDASSYTTTTNHDLSGITNLSNILTLEQQFSSGSGVIIFESPVRRKCIMKHSKKPRFSQWKNYWLQLIGGNLLIYYPMKAIMFNPGSTKQRANCEQEYIEELVGAGELQQRIANGGQYTENADIHQIHQEMQQQQNRERLHAQLQQRKSAYNKNPCKMHPIANWMVVNLYQDKEEELMQTAQAALHPQQQPTSTVLTTPTNPLMGSQNSTTPQQQQQGHQHQPSVNLNAQLNSPHFSKFDIQLNDLTTSTMYKFRFDGLQLAKEWLEQFKLASTYHERQNQDNLIRFD